MRLLILGGTVFLGRHVVLADRAAGHDITLLNRGRSQPELFPTLRRVTADGDGGLGPIEHARWDAVIDTSGFLPRDRTLKRDWEAKLLADTLV